MKILQIVDVQGWAIDRLAQSIIKHNPQHRFRTLYIPPRDAEDPARIKDVKDVYKWADIIHFQYWRTYDQLIKKLPELEKKKLILTHHNEKNIFSTDPSTLDAVTVCTKYQQDEMMKRGLERIYRIPYGIDLDKSYWNEDYPPKEVKIGYVGRIKRWKRFQQVALACQELGYKLIFMGRRDDEEYWKEIVAAMGGEEKMKETIEYHMNEPEEKMHDVYKQMTVYVGNSWEGRETGTIPFLDALAIGVPVLTTLAGLAKDIIRDGENAVVLDFNNPQPDSKEWEKANKEDIKKKLKMIVEDEELRKKLRNEGWKTVKNMTEAKMAREYSVLYNRVLYPSGTVGDTMVSVIVPTYNRKNEVLKILDSLKNQTYPNIETIICDDNSNDGTEEVIIKYRSDNPDLCIKYLNTKKDGYNLAMARNMGAIEAEGGILVFCDSRFVPMPSAIRSFVEAMLHFTKDQKNWLWGDKGWGQRNFVENWSCIRRQHFINFGMFNERIDRYGGMSQEIRRRFAFQGGDLGYVETAKAREIKTAHKWDLKRRKDVIDMKFKLWKMNM